MRYVVANLLANGSYQPWEDDEENVVFYSTELGAQEEQQDL